MNRNVIRIHPQDNVAVAVVSIARGDSVTGADMEVLPAVTDIPRHHKVAVAHIASDAPIVKYGEVIARARTAIRAGEWVHTHNIIA
ncbi:UxaA family hydrolase [Desulfatitalea tepidiphila]|uniref:UxaA family hydrolase n=1 Tax=Desulfatitalea tepidiphila TaxID=1185843 RepID=UPI0006B633C9|nr:UxaA family hydrolase [Desulfatitalea tepidiphila]